MVVHRRLEQRKDSGDPRRILVSVPNWVGDVVMATAALRAIRTRFSQSYIVHLMRPYVADVLSDTGLCDELAFWPPKARGGPLPRDRTRERQPQGRILGLIRRLRTQRFDWAILFTNSFRSALVARLAGIRRRTGYSRDGRGWLLNDKLKPRRRNGRFVPVPALDYYNDLARHVGCSEVDDRLVLAASEADEKMVRRRLGRVDPNRPLVVLNPGANFGPAKCWPAEKYATLADALVDRFGARVVASLGPNERDISDRLRSAVQHPIEILDDPPLGLGPLRALIRACDLLVTNDTGPRHFAAALGTPVVCIFGSSDPAWTDTRYSEERIVKLNLDCQPCMKRVCPLGHHDCMRKLEPESVLAKIEELLAAHRRIRGNP